jgi:hypothetical protein
MLYDFTMHKLEAMAEREEDGIKAMWLVTLANLYYDGAVTIDWIGGQPVPTVVLHPSEVADIFRDNL